MKKHKKQKHPRIRTRSQIKPPYFINRNQYFDSVRKQMTMKIDGPTLNEISDIDSTVSVEQGDPQRFATTRPVNTSNQIKKMVEWWR